MTFRRILASFFVFLFVVFSLPTFFVYAFSKTFFNGSFYGGPVSDKTYNYFVDTVTKNFYRSDSTLQRHFSEEEINQEMREVFSAELFRNIMNDIGQQVENLKRKPQEPVTLSFKVFRDSLLTISHNLAYNIFQSLPTCKKGELSEVNEEGISTCIPSDLDYVMLAGPLSKQFEKAVYGSFPEQIQIDLTSAKGQNKDLLISFFSGIDKARISLLAVLLFLVLLITSLVYDRFMTLLKYQAIAFLLSGAGGIFVSLSFDAMPNWLLQAYQQNKTGFSTLLGDRDRLQDLLNYIFSFPKMETQKIAIIFIILGAILLSLRFFLSYRHSLKNRANQSPLPSKS